MTSTPTFPDTSAHEALPSNVAPTHYKIHLFNLDTAKNTFSGVANIHFDVNGTTSSIILHQKFLEFQKAKIVANLAKTRTEIPVKSVKKNDSKETVEFRLSEDNTSAIAKGSIDMEIHYTGVIRTDMAGFYSSHYEDKETGKTEYILTTQFESAEARSAFPSYDEPSSKATFDISLTVDKNLCVLSNMPVASSKTLDSGKKGPGFDKPLKEVRFETSPKMSTYLVAWAVGKFEYIEDQTDKVYSGNHIPIRVYTLPGQSETGKFALSVAKKDVDYLSKIFDVDYPLPKLDLLAVPQFGAHAMENWGMVTFRATALLFDPAKSDAAYQQSVAYTVSHEIAHSWFGNYVTMSWWSHLWLNESFATFVGSLCVENMYPEWDTFTDFVTNGVEVALDLDSLRNSHPIEVKVNTAAEIDEIFDPISYLKGGSVIRMVANAVGIDVFLKGVSKYLKKYAFGNAKSDDLWDAVSQVSGIDITGLVSPWIRAVGHPYLSVFKSADSKSIKITQKRFLSSGDATAKDDEITWWIPNVSALEGGKKEATVPAEGFLKLNKDTYGFYQVIYDDALFQNILAHLDQLSPEDKIGLIADTSAGAQAGLMRTSQLLDLLYALKDNEDNVNVWTEAVKRLNTLKQLYFSDPDVLKMLNGFSKDLFSGRFTKLQGSKQSLSFQETKLEALLFAETGVAGCQQAISIAEALYKAGNISPYLKLPVYKTLLANPDSCTQSVFDTVIKEAKEPVAIDSTEICLSALGYIANDTLLDKVLSLYFSKYVLEMDYSFLTISLVENPRTKVAFWKFFESHYPDFRNKVAMWTLDRLIKSFLPKLVSADLYKDASTFFADKDTTGYTKGLKQGLDSIKYSLLWSDRSKTDVFDWLKSKGY